MRGREKGERAGRRAEAALWGLALQGRRSLPWRAKAGGPPGEAWETPKAACPRSFFLSSSSEGERRKKEAEGAGPEANRKSRPIRTAKY